LFFAEDILGALLPLHQPSKINHQTLQLEAL